MTGAARELGLDAYSEAMYPLHHYGWSDLRALRAGPLQGDRRAASGTVRHRPGPARSDATCSSQRRAMGDGMIAQLRSQEERLREDRGGAAGRRTWTPRRGRAWRRSATSGRSSPARPTRGPAAPTRRTRSACSTSSGRPWSCRRSAKDGQARPSTRSWRCSTRCWRGPAGHRRLVHAGDAVPAARRPEQAVEYFKKTLELKPDYDLAVINLAQAYRRLGDDEAALAGFERYLQLDPKDAYVRYQMGEIWLDRGDLAKAEQVFPQGARDRPQGGAAKNALGVIALERGDLPAAERLIREALAIKPDVRLAHYNLALIAEKRGDMPGAEREYLEELKQHPDSYKAAFNLSRLYEQVGDREGQIDALEAVDRGQPAVPRGPLLPGQGLPRRGHEPRRGRAAWRRRAWRWRRSPSTRRSATTCWPTSSTGRAARRKPRRKSRSAARWSGEAKVAAVTAVRGKGTAAGSDEVASRPPRPLHRHVPLRAGTRHLTERCSSAQSNTP